MKFVIEEAWCQYENKKTGIHKFYDSIKHLSEFLDCETMVFDKKFLKNIKNIYIQRLIYFIWLNTIFPLKCLLLNDDVVVLGAKYFIPFFRVPRVKYVPMVHDLIAIKYPDKIPKSSAVILKLATLNAIKNGHIVATASETAKRDIIETYNYPAEKIYILNGALSIDKNIILNEDEQLQKFKISKKKYILSVSSLSGHKNIDTLIKAFNTISNEYSEIKLLIVGNGKNLEYYKRLACANIIFTGFVNDEELKVLYKNALLYAFPSLLEGFGLPIIDSQNYGIPIVCSDIPVFHDVAGDGALYAAPTVNDFKEGLVRLLSDKRLQQELIDLGYENVKRFSDEELLKQLKKVVYGGNL